MADGFHDKLLALGGVRITDGFVLSPEKMGTRYLLNEDGGCAMRITGADAQTAIAAATAFLAEHSAYASTYPVDYSGP